MQVITIQKIEDRPIIDAIAPEDFLLIGDASDSQQVKRTLVSDLTDYILSPGETDVSWDSISDKPETFPPTDHNHAIANVSGLSEELSSLDARVTDLENNPDSQGSESLAPDLLSANTALQSNKYYLATQPDLVCTLPEAPAIGDTIDIATGDFTLRIYHGNESQRILNNNTYTVTGSVNGVALKPFSSIRIRLCEPNLWVSSFRVRAINNYQSPQLEAEATQKTYTATALESYSYIDSGRTIASINDSNPNDGVIKIGGGTANRLIMTATFAQPTELHQIRVRCGQFNGEINMPESVSIYKGSGVNTGNLVETLTSIHSPNNTLRSLTNIQQDTVFTFEFVAPNLYLSINDLALFGKVTEGGETQAN